MKTITYAIEVDSGLVISRLNSEIACPVLEFEKIGQDGNYNKPFEYTLEKMPVNTLVGIWNSYKWTKKIPVTLKNVHRKFWGMKPLKIAPQSLQKAI